MQVTIIELLLGQRGYRRRRSLSRRLHGGSHVRRKGAPRRWWRCVVWPPSWLSVSLAYTRKHDADPPRRVAIRPWLPLARWSSTWLQRRPAPTRRLGSRSPGASARIAKRTDKRASRRTI